MSEPKILHALTELNENGFYDRSTHLGDVRENPNCLDNAVENGIYVFTGGESSPKDTVGSMKWVLDVKACDDGATVKQKAEPLCDTEYKVLYKRSLVGGSWSEFHKDLDESIIGLSVEGQTVTYVKADGSVHTFTTQDTDTTYSLATDEVTGLTKLYATTGSNEDGTMTQKAIKTELDKKVRVFMNTNNNTLVFTNT